jgi:hypothetical protein
MKKILCIAAVLSMAAPSAFGQASGTTPIVYAPNSGSAPEIAVVTSAVKKELERSRQLEPLYVRDDTKAQLTVPLDLQKDAAGQNMTVKYELRTGKRYTEAQEVTCAVAKAANCARDIVIAAEKFVRKNKDR